MPTERQLDMSEKEVKPKNLSDISPLLKNGDEPTELLLALAWSPIETLVSRGLARVFVGKGAVAIFLHETDLVPHLGLVPTDAEVLAGDK